MPQSQRYTLAFADSGLDRAAHRRTRAQDLWQAGQGDVLVFWRGKPLLDDAGAFRVGMDDPLLDLAVDQPVYLGQDAGVDVFAADISGWVPAKLDDTVGAFFDPSRQTHPDLPASAGFEDLRQRMTTLPARDAELLATAKAILEWHRSHRFCSACGQQSQMAMGGWERLCPSCGAKHFPRTDPVVIMLITRGNKVLLGRSPFWPEDMYSLLAGFVEPGETVEAAVRREVFEETQVKVGVVRYLASQPWPFPNSLMIGCHGQAISDRITLDPVELDDALWLSREQVALAMAGGHPTIKPARRGSIAHFLLAQWLADRVDHGQIG